MTIEDEQTSSSRGGHWEYVHFAESAINSVGGGSALIPAFTEATYALFEDTGWYQATYAAAGWTDYGFQQGCGFAASVPRMKLVPASEMDPNDSHPKTNGND